ncbi:hypothetical protein [Okeania sp. KiyG1]|uniref:hypothetical protein n=1 Tax=Okeania sp. KiyG1 TaxID=2720165 RepID=UPI0019203CA1|nr:hypothetical protein [Okeania sp. KiyG1]GGA53228.1 hypothetical protein CYANOKiyG1_73290 [Okeania sp. KiyG1]
MSMRDRDLMAIVEMKTRGIIKVGRLEDGCLYQEVYFGPAFCRYRPDDLYMFHGEDWLEKYVDLVKREFTNCFNKLGYFQAEKIPRQEPENEEEDRGGDSDSIPF